MNSIAAHFCPLALLLPALAGSVGERPTAERPLGAAVAHAAPKQSSPALGLRADEAVAALRVLEDAHRPPPQNQVRIESRVVIRISPSPEAQRDQLLAALPRRQLRTTYAEVDHGECVAIAQIVGVEPAADDRLLLFLRDRRVLAAELERSCSARSFYSGFYIERSEDGQLCVERDRLQSRSGASCEVEDIQRLVAVRD